MASHQLLAVGHPLGVGVVAGVEGPLRDPQHAAEGLPQPLVAGAHHEVAVPGPERLVGHQRGVRAAPAALDLAPHEVGRGGVDEGGDPALHEREIDVLAPAGLVPVAQGGQDGPVGVEGGDGVDEGHPHLDRRAAGLAGDGHEAREALEDGIVPGPVAIRAGGPEAGDGAVDQPGVGGLDRAVPQARGCPWCPG